MTPGTNGLPEPISWLEWLIDVKEIGEGNCCTVYSACDPLTGECFALKKYSGKAPYRDERRNEKRFGLEIACHCRLHHPHIVQMRGHGKVGRNWYLVMSLVEGKTLDTLISAGSLSLKEKLVIGVQIAQAVAYMHSQRVIHRDIKPVNVIVANGNAFLFDLGLALLDGEKDALTQDGMTVGTAYNMAPEQARADGCDNRTDIYGFGTILYELLTSRPVFEGKTPSVMFQHIESHPIPLRDRDPAIPEGVEAIVLKALEKQPEDRFQTAAEMAAELQTALEKLQVQQPAERAS